MSSQCAGDEAGGQPETKKADSPRLGLVLVLLSALTYSVNGVCLQFATDRVDHISVWVTVLIRAGMLFVLTSLWQLGPGRGDLRRSLAEPWFHVRGIFGGICNCANYF